MPDIFVKRAGVVGLAALKAVANTRINGLTNRQYLDGPFL